MILIAPPDPVMPDVQLQGHDMLLYGRLMRSPGAAEGFTFCPYPFGTAEHDNFVLGCMVAAFRH